MKRILFWIGVAVACFVIPAVVAEYSAHYISSSSSRDFLMKALVYVISFQFTLAMSLALNWELERGQISKSIADTTQAVIISRIEEAIDGGLIKLFVKGQTGTDVAALFRNLAEMMASRLRETGPEMLQASAVFLQDQIATALSNYDELLGEGLSVDIAQHLQTTRHLCTRYPSYLQIQRRAFQAPEEWTAGWLHFLDEISKSGIKKKYIVLASAAELNSQTEKLESMRSYLTNHGFEFAICNTADIIDSTGGAMLTDGVIEIFGDRIIKIGDLPEGRYQGGIKLRMLLLDGEKRRDVLNLVGLVQLLSKEPKT